MAKLSYDGFDAVERTLQNLSDRADTLAKGVSIEKILTPRFLMRTLRFRDVDEFFTAAGGQLIQETQSWHFEDDNALDTLVAERSSYRNYDELVAEATEEYLHS